MGSFLKKNYFLMSAFNFSNILDWRTDKMEGLAKTLFSSTVRKREKSKTCERLNFSENMVYSKYVITNTNEVLT